MPEWYKQLKNGQAVGYPIARQNIIQVHPALDLSNIIDVIAVGYCEYDMVPEPQVIPKPLLQEWRPGPDKKISDGRWQRTWELHDIDHSPEVLKEITEMMIRDIRQTRDYVLSRTDFYALQDTEPMPEEIKLYRQQLRDLLDNIDDPWNVTWPVDPINRERGMG